MVKPLSDRVAPSHPIRVAVLVLSMIAFAVLVLRLGNSGSSSPEAAPSVHAREVAWACEANENHRFKSRFRYEPLPCRTCNGRCFIQLDYTCPEHHRSFVALVKFDRRPSETEGGTAEDSAIISRFKHVGAADWRSSDGTVACTFPGCKTPARRSKTAWSTTKISSLPLD